MGLVLGLLADGSTVEDVLADYPSLSESDVRACLACGARLTSGRFVDTVVGEGLSGQSDRALVTLGLDFADAMRFPPGETSGLIVLRVHGRPGRQDLDAVVERLLVALERAGATRRPWIVEPTRVRQFEESSRTTRGAEERGV